jgi:hypothetical protein
MCHNLNRSWRRVSELKNIWEVMTMYVHVVWFVSRTEPERFVLADRKLYDDYLKWLKGPSSDKGGWAYEHHGGALTVLNFDKVSHMTVRPQAETPGEAVAPASAEQSILPGAPKGG